MEANDEAQKLKSHYEELIKAYKKIEKKLKTNNNQDNEYISGLYSEQQRLINSITMFNAKYINFMKPRKNSFGKFCDDLFRKKKLSNEISSFQAVQSKNMERKSETTPHTSEQNAPSESYDVFKNQNYTDDEVRTIDPRLLETQTPQDPSEDPLLNRKIFKSAKDSYIQMANQPQRIPPSNKTTYPYFPYPPMGYPYFSRSEDSLRMMPQDPRMFPPPMYGTSPSFTNPPGMNNNLVPPNYMNIPYGPNHMFTPQHPVRMMQGPVPPYNNQAFSKQSPVYSSFYPQSTNQNLYENPRAITPNQNIVYPPVSPSKTPGSSQQYVQDTTLKKKRRLSVQSPLVREHEKAGFMFPHFSFTQPQIKADSNELQKLEEFIAKRKDVREVIKDVDSEIILDNGPAYLLYRIVDTFIEKLCSTACKFARNREDINVSCDDIKMGLYSEFGLELPTDCVIKEFKKPTDEHEKMVNAILKENRKNNDKN
ncbi:hypothetical protein CWI38_1676p0010 [Hamiltosporidium tvaerminnensis]|uniref:Transcription initiation factor TFIID subunit 12 domain-containing protein n=1 Tax=Hamiltosporidium tvaerminnensis TaxID=1176355 RepID=A0A4Q9LSR6_9MICR|nr:hypothetical protein CWI38_1676p0010 [Hamiltosporidium tvaerminnensis]